MYNRELKILFISSWYPQPARPLNGIFIKRHAAANTLDCNVSVIFICSGKNNSIEESVEDGIYTIRGYYKTPLLKIPLFYPVLKLIKYLLLWKKTLSVYKTKNGKPDLVNSNIVYPVSFIAALINFTWKVPYVITEHWTGYLPEDGRYKGFMRKMISKIATVRAEAIITPSCKLSSTMQSLGLIPKKTAGGKKYFIIPNVVDVEQFKLKQASATNANFNFLHISSLDDEQKNISGILRTFRKFHTLHPLSKLTIVWDEEAPEFLEKLGKENFREETGVFLNGKKAGVELAGFFREANAFILFSNFENLPVVMLESFCCGVPVISTRVGDVQEYINEKNGILIEPGNEEQLLAAMENIFMNQGNYNPAEIRDMVANKVSSASISKQFTDIYKMVLSYKTN